MGQDDFISPTQGKLTPSELVESISQWLHEEPQAFYRLVIGSDSQERHVNGTKLCNFVTAVVVHKVGRGGRYFWKNGRRERIHSIRQKIYTETLLSLETAGKLVPQLRQKLNGNLAWDLEIHIDVGTVGQTRDMIKEVVGMVIGNGYTARTKPDSYAATTIADRHA